MVLDWSYLDWIRETQRTNNLTRHGQSIQRPALLPQNHRCAWHYCCHYLPLHDPSCHIYCSILPPERSSGLENTHMDTSAGGLHSNCRFGPRLVRSGTKSKLDESPPWHWRSSLCPDHGSILVWELGAPH